MLKNMLRIIAALIITSVSVVAHADKADKKRGKIHEMREEVLTQLFKERPQTRAEIDGAEGYAVFSNVGVNVIFLSAGGGKGVVKDMKSGKYTYMKMGTAGVGLGLGIKDFRAVFVFHDRDAMNDFIEKGWDFSGQADAAVVSDEKGGEANESTTFSKKVTVYQFTKAGLALQATLQGTKYWKDKKLNRP